MQSNYFLRVKTRIIHVHKLLEPLKQKHLLYESPFWVVTKKNGKWNLTHPKYILNLFLAPAMTISKSIHV